MSVTNMLESYNGPCTICVISSLDLQNCYLDSAKYEAKDKKYLTLP